MPWALRKLLFYVIGFGLFNCVRELVMNENQAKLG